MPLHLDSQSRRHFFGGAAIFALSPAANLLSANAGSQTWALLSDTHIAADKSKHSRQGINMYQHLKQVVAEVLAEKDELTGIIIDGDCAFNDGQPGDYKTLIELLSPLTESGLPIHCTLGNHDNRDTFYDASVTHCNQSPVESKHCSVIETHHADWILLDTLRFVNKVEGELGKAQLDWLAQRLSVQPEKPAIIVGHHFPQIFRTDVIPSEKEIKISGLIDSEPFLKLLADHPAAKAYFYGHSHHWRLEQDESNFHHINLPPTAYVFDPKRPAGWVRATVNAGGLALELRSIDVSHEQHGERHELTWR